MLAFVPAIGRDLFLQPRKTRLWSCSGKLFVIIPAARHRLWMFLRSFGSRFEFILEPNPAGWEIVIKEYGRDENLSRLTPPFHSVPNSREIEGWHLSDNPSACATRSYKADAGPANPRKLIFSPEVGKRIDGKKQTNQ